MHSFESQYGKTKMNETRETEIGSQDVFLQFSSFLIPYKFVQLFLHPELVGLADIYPVTGCWQPADEADWSSLKFRQ